MAKKAASIVGVTPQPEQEPFIPEPEIPFSPEQRTVLRTLLSDPIFKIAVRNARLSYPGPFKAPGFDPANATDCQRQISQQQGWRMFEAALWSQCTPKPERKKSLVETYPDAGLRPT